MKSWPDAATESFLPPGMLLDQAEMAVIVTDRHGSLRYLNPFAARLFRLSGDAAGFLGQSLLSIGFAGGDERKAARMTAAVLRGRTWEGTFAGGATGPEVLVRAYAVPLRHRSGAVGGIAVFAREAGRGTLAERDRIGVLEQIGERLGGSLELGATLRQVTEMLVPHFADHCIIDLFQGDTLIRRVQANASGWEPPAGTWAAVGEPVHYPPGHFCQQAMARLESVVVRDLEEEHIPAPSTGSRRAGREAGMVSVIAVPLSARGQLLGVMSLALSRLTSRAARHYGAADRELFGAIGGRIAVAIDNAMLFEAERQTALAFQQSLLPQELPALDGLEVACRYVPAGPLETHGQGIQTQVGGDWYDVIPLAAGRVGIVIGDVEGRGARAAAIMGQLRAALRAFAQDEKPPADILRKLDDWCRSMAPAAGGTGLTGDPPIVSCAYLVYDPWSRELTFANAGHEPPLLIAGGQAAQLPARDKGVLLGVRGKGIRGLPTYQDETVVLPPGATLVLYTDGLTNRRARVDGTGHYSEDEARGMLCQAVTAAAGKDAAAVAHAAEESVPGEIDDDMAVLVVRCLPGDLHARERMFRADPVMVAEARAVAMETFQAWGLDEAQAELGCLLVSEVATNAVLHAAVPGGLPSPGERAGFTLRLRRGSEAIWVEVFDTDMRLPRIRAAEDSDEGGRGLYLVDQLATRWGSRPTRDGKAVWFEIPASAQP